MTKIELHLPVTDTTKSIVEYLATECRSTKLLSNSDIKSAINKGSLWLERNKRVARLRKIKKALCVDDVLHFYYDEHILSLPTPNAQLIADFGDYSVIYKPSGMPTQGSKWSDHCAITRWAETTMQPQRPAFLVHRLDKATSGLILIAHSKKAARALSQLFEKRAVTKRYQAIVHGIPEQSSWQVKTSIENKNAGTTFNCLKTDQISHLSLLDVDIDTGRKHQIRIHCAESGLPIVGDRLHGIADASSKVDLQLTAISLSFTCPFSHQQREVNLATALRPNINTVAKLLIS